jgi:uncharacterized membrane protein
MTDQEGQPEFRTAGRERIARLGLGATGIIAVISMVVGFIDSGTTRPWLSFMLTIVVVALVLGFLPRMHGWRTVPWVSIAMVTVIAGGFIIASGAVLGLGALVFVIATSVHEARNRRSPGIVP